MRIIRIPAAVLTIIFWGAAILFYAQFMTDLYNMTSTSFVSFVPMFYCSFSAIIGAVFFTLAVGKRGDKPIRIYNYRRGHY
jgi:uncharacterized membrane protein YwaF